MFNYIPKKSIKKKLLGICKTPYDFEKEKSFIHSIIKNCTHQEYVVFRMNYLYTSFYSPIKLDKIVVGGYYFPVELFEIE